MRGHTLYFLAALAACDSPDPLSDFAGAPPTRIDLAGSVYSVRVAGSKAQAIRTSSEISAVGRRADYVARAGLAMEHASGCKLAAGSLRGDAAMAEARLLC